MSEREESHDSHVDGGSQSEGEEVVFRECATGVESSTASPAHTASPQMVTKSDLQDIIDGWKTKFHQLSEGIRAIQMASEKFNAHMDNLQRDSHAAFRTCKKASRASSRDATPQFAKRARDEHALHAVGSAVQTSSRLRPDFNFESPVNQSAPTESTRANGDHYNQRPTHEDDHGNSGDAQHSPNNPNNTELIIRRRARLQAPRFLYSTEQCPRNSARG